jgi:hypothetical protein
MNPSTWTMQDWMTYGPLLNAGVGLIFGLITLVLGFVKGKVKFGIYGFVACLIGGSILGLFLSLPALIFFSWMILKKPTAENVTEIESEFEN